VADQNGHGTNGAHGSADGDDTDHGGGNGRKTFSGAGFGTLMIHMASGPK
jgi:hypothetical protein